LTAAGYSVITYIRDAGHGLKQIGSDKYRRSRLLYWLGSDSHAFQLDELTIEGEVVLRSQFADYLYPLCHSPPPVPLPISKGLKLLVPVALAHSEQELATGYDVHGGGLLRDGNRMVEREQIQGGS